MTLLFAIAFLSLAILIFFATLIGLRHPGRPAWTDSFGVAELAAVAAAVLFGLAAGFLFKHALTAPGVLARAEDAAVILAGAGAIALGWRIASRRIAAMTAPAGAHG
ncbi:hypothetical protein [Futiania mangrovi]|uniref:Uncharacterized protein n=1 Tax=Futiania mangrovi TaxID=2959716 RepID=A0A9J6PLQ9_9PROT|nr:hypothetical protein [Futiania mangrovii]MCP1337575.1 hypothetical protein [Futiania mangrovii]